MNYLNVLYTPLDVPERPEIDYELFKKWSVDVYPQSCINIESKQKFVAHDRLKSKYPWNLVYGMHAGEWQNDFNHLFKDLAEYCYKGFGLEQHHLYTILFLPTRNDFVNKYFWHIDPDSSGLRFYLRNEDVSCNHLLMRRMTQYIPDAWKMPSDVLENMLEPEILYCNMKSKHQAFFLNNVFAAHTPINKRSIDRVAVFVTIKKKHLADVIQNLVDPLVIRSIYKYPEYCILRE